MGKSTLDLIQNPRGSYKSKDYKRRRKGISFLAFVFSVFFYISIFYVFNLSPTQNFKNSKFWFFISNTLILIIAADYGAFSSSNKERRDILYEEYLTRTSLANSNSVGGFVSVLPRDPETVEENVPGEEEKRVILEETKALADVEPEREAERKQSQEAEGMLRNGPQDDEAEKQVEVSGEAEKEEIVVDEEAAEGEAENVGEGKIIEENDEFSRMSDEELNRRVEDFIRKLKRQIQLQGF